MIKKVLFGLIWFVIIFLVSYLTTGVLVVFPSVDIRSNQAIYEAAQAFRNTYMTFFVIGALVLTIAGTVIGVLPGTKSRQVAKKKYGGKKKAHKKGKH
jgi:ABC-type Fe3+ transport system permease subunit